MIKSTVSSIAGFAPHQCAALKSEPWPERWTLRLVRLVGALVRHVLLPLRALLFFGPFLGSMGAGQHP